MSGIMGAIPKLGCSKAEQREAADCGEIPPETGRVDSRSVASGSGIKVKGQAAALHQDGQQPEGKETGDSDG